MGNRFNHQSTKNYHKINRGANRSMKNYHPPTRVFLKLCRLYEQNDKSFYKVLDSLVDVFNKDQLIEVEETILNKFI